MNERIDELMRQAGIFKPKEFYQHIDALQLEKFAELIVRECADIAYKTSWDDLVHEYGQAVIPLHLHNTIKKHFGVEE